MRTLRNSRGYTMIELMIVIAIIAIVAAISIPNLTVWLSRTRLNNAVTRLERSVVVARKMALTERAEYCLSLSSDTGWADGDSENYLIGVTVAVRDASSESWQLVTSPVELGSWTNDPSTELYKGISMEGDPTTTTLFGDTNACQGLLFNNRGYLTNATADFAFPCGGAQCAKITLRNKVQSFVEQRTLWIDRGGNVRVTIGPETPPELSGASPS